MATLILQGISAFQAAPLGLLGAKDFGACCYQENVGPTGDGIYTKN